MDIGSLSMEGDHKWRPLLQEKYIQICPKISPDGRWMAYVSWESGKSEVFVRPFPEVNKGKWQVSTSGGIDPLWSPDGRELFYRSDDSVMAVAVETGPTFKAEKPEALFRDIYISPASYEYEIDTWDISPDGNRFLMMKESGSEFQSINIVVNWFEELKQKVPVD